MHRREWSDDAGMTLIETMIAMLVLLFGLLALAQVSAFSVIVSKTHGRDSTLATTFAHDKMEELRMLDFADTTTNVTVAAPFPANGIGLTAGGSLPPTAPVVNYVDYLDGDGLRIAAGPAVMFTRQWQIVNEAAGLKKIVVGVTSNKSFRNGVAPSTVIVTYKTP
jgi:Tfp pilus assembly protein PilV